ncbi:MAG: hypothetical protein WCK37_02310 [Candidatus Falkowbacteria bacterium]
MNNQLQKILSLVKRTGDRIIVFDPVDSDKSYVVMDIEQYEKILSPSPVISDKKVLTSTSTTDKIDSGEKMWKTEKNFQEDNIYSSAQIIENQQKNNWKIPGDVRKAADSED